MYTVPSFCVAAIAVGGSLGCSGTSTDPQERAKTPDRVFIAKRLQIEEQQDGKILWSGTVDRASGDMTDTDLENLDLIRHPRRDDEQPLTISAPRGRLSFDDGRAHFESVLIREPEGSEVSAASADYSERSETITAAGPLHLRSSGLTATATGATIHIKENRMDLSGPVLGRWAPEGSETGP